MPILVKSRASSCPYSQSRNDLVRAWHDREKDTGPLIQSPVLRSVLNVRLETDPLRIWKPQPHTPALL